MKICNFADSSGDMPQTEETEETEETEKEKKEK